MARSWPPPQHLLDDRLPRDLEEHAELLSVHLEERRRERVGREVCALLEAVGRQPEQIRAPFARTEQEQHATLADDHEIEPREAHRFEALRRWEVLTEVLDLGDV